MLAPQQAPGDWASSNAMPVTLPEALARWALLAPDRTAVVHQEQSLTYAELAARADSIAYSVIHRDLRPGDRVVLVGDNSLAWVCAYLGVLRAGAVVVAANNRLNPSQFREQCDLVDASLVLHDPAYAELAQASGRTSVDLGDLLAMSAPDALLQWPEPADDALISFTSGTTGTPKGAVLSHDALFRGSAVWPDYVGTGPGDSTLVMVPLFHNTGFIDQLGHMLIAGGSTHLLTKFHTLDAVSELAARPVTFHTAVPSILRLLTVSDGADSVYGPARIVEFGGSPMPAAWSEELLGRWPHLQLIHGYGLSEFTSVCTFLPPDLVLDAGESVGRPAPGVQLQITRADGRPAETNEVGEVWVAGATRMSRYWNQPALTKSKFVGQWLRTGDLGRVDRNGLLWLSGRVDDAINRGGEKVLPAFVEARIASLSGIAEACVFGYDDAILQQRVGVAIRLRPDADFDETEARTQLLDQLPDYAVPEQWVIYGELPRTASGKTDRRAISRDFHHKEN